MPGWSGSEPHAKTLRLSLCGTMIIHLIDASEISIPAERGTKRCGVGNQRANARENELSCMNELESVLEDHIP